MPALIFDCDGVLADTELDGHLPAFNDAFTEFHLDLHWDVPTYAEKVKIGGGKERIASDLPQRADTDELVRGLHRRKTELFLARVRDGLLPGRPGIHRLVAEALSAGWTVAVASTSAEASVRGVLGHAVGPELAAQCHVYAGDIVTAKKPAPDIYLLVLNDLALSPGDCVVVEDSGIGLQAAQAAGLTTVITVSAFSAEDDFTGAALVVDHLGEPDNPSTLIAGSDALLGGFVTLSTLESLLPSMHQEEPR